ncbi:chemotaxis protein CheX [Aquibacillus sediminis]|uniref:chemotaxis protein CheX n=1 Tax=Aquibacillus sediminis TaxID=2574734 RepID=UPI0011099CD5|nr:chemotaxis protein CheX [Aquibacillus sediminis]
MGVTAQRSQHVTSLLNGTIGSIKNVVPLDVTVDQPKLLEQALTMEFGVLIGITGDLRGKMVLTGDMTVFGTIGEKMFGMALEGEMLASFSGELGNMIAGGLSTNIVEQGIRIDITSPTMFQGATTLSGYDKALQVPVTFENAGDMGIYLLID